MIKSIHILVSLLFLTVISQAQKKEEKAVRETFKKYKSAILNDRGEEAVKYVDSRTIKYYGDIIELVKTADSAKTSALPLMDKLMVLLIRHRSTREEILSFDGKGLLVYAIKSGMVGKSSIANNEIGDVTIDGTFAKGQFMANGQKAPFYYHFYKEEEQWKVDLTSIFPIGVMAFKRMVENSGQSENEYLLSLLEMTNGKKPGNEVWERVK